MTRSKIAPHSSLGMLEGYLQPGDSVDVRIERVRLNTSERNWRTQDRFKACVLDSNGRQCYTNTGNTISACITGLAKDLQRYKPMSPEDFQETAAAIAQGETIDPLVLRKFKAFLDKMVVEED